MTEAEWLVCTDQRQMVKYLRHRKASVRKWRLVAVACGHKIWHLLEDDWGRKAILTAERFADGEFSKDELRAAHKKAYDAYCRDERDLFDPKRDAMGVAAGAAMTIPGHAFNRATLRVEPSEVCALLRETFGNPFRPVVVEPSWMAWHDGTVVKLAQATYEEGVFDRMLILADALEEAGCTNADILGHCRSDRPHVKGCWVIDLLLGKS